MLGRTYAHTWDPVSGITVNRTCSSSRRSQAIFSRDERAATSSGRVALDSFSITGQRLVPVHGCGDRT